MAQTNYFSPKLLLKQGMKVVLGKNSQIADVAYGMDGTSLVFVLYKCKGENDHYVTKVIPLSEYNNELDHEWFPVNKIYNYEKWPVGNNGISYGRDLLWEREKEMTLAEVENIIGCKIKIIDS